MPQTFTDAKGRRWAVDVSVTAVKRVKKLTGVNLYALVDDGFKPLEALLGDPCQLVDVAYALVKDEADAAGVTDEQFGAGLGGDSIGALADAFVEALVDFFPDARRRQALRDVIAKGKKVADLVDRRAAREIAAGLDGIDPEKLADELYAGLTSRTSSTPAPAASGSTPAPSSSAS